MKNSLFTTPFLVQPHSQSGGAIAIHRYPQANGEMHSGFTLVEVMVVIILAGILMAIAVPNISNFIANGRISSAANDLVSDLMLARGAATSSRHLAIVCASSATTCTPTAVTCSASDNDWISAGRLVFIDNHSIPGTTDGICKNGDTVIKHTSSSLTPNALPSPTSIVGTGFTNDYIAFNSYGVMVPMEAGHFTLCVTNATQCRHISVDFSGRASVTKVP
jgi:prepilin-type N-terminal cleavage/methylation domain-containing protein